MLDLTKKKPADSAFTMLFNIEEHAVDLYEYLTDIKLDVSQIRSVRLQDGMVKSSIYNDVSFITEDNQLFVLIEHQSTVNPNMGFRILEYFVKLVSEFLKEHKVDLFGRKVVQIPKASFFVVYNGKGTMQDLPILDLGDVQVSARVKNIHFETLVNKCTTNSVAGYARFVELAKIMDPIEATETLLKEGYLTDFLKDKERRNMFADTYSYENELIYMGQQEKAIQVAINSLEKGLDIQTIADITELDLNTILKLKRD